MAVGSRSRRSPRRGGGGGAKLGGAIFVILLLAGLVAFYQIPVSPTVHGFVATLQYRSEQVSIWANDVVKNIGSFKFDPHAPGTGSPAPSSVPTPKSTSGK